MSAERERSEKRSTESRELNDRERSGEREPKRPLTLRSHVLLSTRVISLISNNTTGCYQKSILAYYVQGLNCYLQPTKINQQNADVNLKFQEFFSGYNATDNLPSQPTPC